MGALVRYFMGTLRCREDLAAPLCSECAGGLHQRFVYGASPKERGAANVQWSAACSATIGRAKSANCATARPAESGHLGDELERQTLHQEAERAPWPLGHISFGLFFLDRLHQRATARERVDHERR